VDSRSWPCPPCGEIREFVQPPCADDHADECPEWACVDCGAAVVVGDVVPADSVVWARVAA
jgi:hypothetical protein